MPDAIQTIRAAIERFKLIETRARAFRLQAQYQDARDAWSDVRTSAPPLIRLLGAFMESEVCLLNVRVDVLERAVKELTDAL